MLPLDVYCACIHTYMLTYFIFPDQGSVDGSLFEEIPPAKCQNGTDSARFRVNCDDEGYPIPEKVKQEITQEDKWRAETKTPRHDYR